MFFTTFSLAYQGKSFSGLQNREWRTSNKGKIVTHMDCHIVNKQQLIIFACFGRYISLLKFCYIDFLSPT